MGARAKTQLKKITIHIAMDEKGHWFPADTARAAVDLLELEEYDTRLMTVFTIQTTVPVPGTRPLPSTDVKKTRQVRP